MYIHDATEQAYKNGYEKDIKRVMKTERPNMMRLKRK